MRIFVDSNADWLKLEFRKATVEAIEEAQRATIARAQELVPHGATGKLENGFKAVGPVPTYTSIRGMVINTVFYARFQEFGTLGSRKKALSPLTVARRSQYRREKNKVKGISSGAARFAKVEGNAGVPAQYFLTRGARVGRKVLVEAIHRLTPP